VSHHPSYLRSKPADSPNNSSRLFLPEAFSASVSMSLLVQSAAMKARQFTDGILDPQAIDSSAHGITY
jgi:hypothetical protein